MSSGMGLTRHLWLAGWCKWQARDGAINLRVPVGNQVMPAGVRIRTEREPACHGDVVEQS